MQFVFSSTITMGKTPRKEMPKLFSRDYDVYLSFLATNDMVKCCRDVNFEKIDTERLTRKYDGF